MRLFAAFVTLLLAVLFCLAGPIGPVAGQTATSAVLGANSPKPETGIAPDPAPGATTPAGASPESRSGPGSAPFRASETTDGPNLTEDSMEIDENLENQTATEVPPENAPAGRQGGNGLPHVSPIGGGASVSGTPSTPIAPPTSTDPGNTASPSTASEGIKAPGPQIASGPRVASWTPDPEITAMLASDPSLLEKKLDLAMRKVLKNPATLTITIQASDPEAASRGSLQQVVVHEENGEVDSLVLAKADIFFNEVQLDTTKLVREEKIETISVKNINMDVIIKEADLNAFLAVKAKSIKVDNPKVRLLKDRMELEGSTRYSFMKVKFFASGGFSLHDAKEVWFHPRRLKVNHLAMPRAFIGTIVKRINPVLNLEKFPFRLNLKEIRIEQGALHFTSFRQEN